jgi:hypothetical protein
MHLGLAVGTFVALAVACAQYASNDTRAADAGLDAGLDAPADVAAEAFPDARADGARDAGVLRCTELTGATTMLAVQNERDEPVTAVWLHYDADAGPGCREAPVGRVDAHAVSYFTTYGGHAWAIRSTANDALLTTFVVPVSDAGSLTVVVP